MRYGYAHPFLRATCAWPLLVSALFAEADPLAVIPDDALGIAVVRNLSETSAAVARLTQKMQIPAPDLLGLAKSYAGVDKGLNEKGSAAAAIFRDPQHEDQLQFLVVVPVTDFKVFIAALGPDDADARIAQVKVAGEAALVVHKGEFAVFTDTDQHALLERVLSSSKSVVATLEPLAPWMAQQQFVVAATPAGKSRLFRTLLNLLPEAAEKPEDEEQDATAAQTTAQLTHAIRPLIAAADRQLTHLALGARIDDKGGARLATRFVLLTDGALSGWAKELKLPPEGLLSGLPSGKFVLAFGGVSAQMSSEFAEFVDQFSQMAFQRIGLSKEARAKVAAASKRQRSGGERLAAVIGTVRPGESVFDRTLSLEQVKDATEHLQAARDVAEALASSSPIKEGGDKLYEFREVEVGDLKAIELTTNMGAVIGINDQNNPGGGMMQQIFAAIFGKDGKMRAYMAAADAHMVASAYDREQLQRLVAHVRSKAAGLESDPDIAKTTKLLMAGPQWVVYLSPQGLLQSIDSVVQGILPGNNFKIPAFPATEPIGMAAKVSPTTIDAEIVLPESVVAAIGQFVLTVRGLFQGGGVPLP
jgi:hypothetical protein